jgi:hypothetical protein
MIKTCFDCKRKGNLSNICFVRHSCKTGQKLSTWLQDCNKLCLEKKCPRGFQL